MMDFEISPQAETPDDEYDFIITATEPKLQTFKYVNFSIPASLESLEACLARLIELHHQTFRIEDLVFEFEQLQYLIFKKLMMVNCSDLGLLIVSLEQELFEEAEHEAESLDLSLRDAKPLPSVGAVWYAGESSWPYIGYLPESKTVLMTLPASNLYFHPELKPSQISQLDRWKNHPLPLSVFTADILRFLDRFETATIKSLKTRIHEQLETLSCL